MEVWPANAPNFGEENTRVCRENWAMARRGRITSTAMHDVFCTKNPAKLAEKLLNPRDISFLPFVARGIADEEAGAQYLLQTLRASGHNVEAYKIGFVTHPEHHWLGASPDRLLRIDEEWALVEIKNWYETKRQKNLRDLPYLDKDLQLKRTHGHYFQIQTALYVTSLKTCYFATLLSMEANQKYTRLK